MNLVNKANNAWIYLRVLNYSSEKSIRAQKTCRKHFIEASQINLESDYSHVMFLIRYLPMLLLYLVWFEELPEDQLCLCSYKHLHFSVHMLTMEYSIPFTLHTVSLLFNF